MDEDTVMYKIYLAIRNHQRIDARKRQLTTRTNISYLIACSASAGTWNQRYDLKRKKFSI